MFFCKPIGKILASKISKNNLMAKQRKESVTTVTL